MSSRGCPFCEKPPEEHETQPGHLHWTWKCKNAPGWRGVFYDRPVEEHSEHDDGDRDD